MEDLCKSFWKIFLVHILDHILDHILKFFYLTFWTTFAPLVLFLQIFLEDLFKVFLQIVKGIGIILQEAFLRFEISPPISNAFPLTK
jgi:hypothetical protein